MKRNYGFLFMIILFLLVSFAGTASAQEEFTPDEKKALLSIAVLHKQGKPLTKAQEAVYRAYILYHFDKSEANLKALKAKLAALKSQKPSAPISKASGISPTLKRAISLYTGTSGPVDEEAAKLLFIEAAENGDPLAVMWLARLYYMGKCMFARDEQKGLELAKKSIEGVKKLAKEGNPDAMFLLGSCYSSGLAVAQDKEKALYWYRKAAKRGHAPAMGNLGYLLMNDPFKDLDKAFYWTKKAADKGVVYAIFNLGSLYHDGLGVTQNYEKASYFFKKAAEKGSPLGMGFLGLCYQSGTGVGKDLEKARYWYEKAASKGNTWAMVQLGLMYRDGQGVRQDQEKAAYWFDKAASKGNADGMYYLGHYYLKVMKNYAKAFDCYKKAAKTGHARAITSLGVMYERGIGVYRDYARAVEYFKEAASLGEGYGMNNLGSMYLHGRGVSKDYEEAVKWIKKAANQGVPVAYYNLGYCYERGKGVKRDKDKAIYWYEKAAEAGYEPAKEKLQELRSSQVGSSGIGGGMPLCFVVPSVSGTPQEYYVAILRLFRNKVLRQSFLGEKIIKAYYTISPYIASYIKDKPIARAMVRYALAPVVFVAGAFLGKVWNMVVMGMIAALMVFVPLLMFRKHRDQIRYQS